MRIAILGAPGSGKTALLERLFENLSVNGEMKLAMIRNPVDQLAAQGRGLGPEATYHETLLMHANQQSQIDLNRLNHLIEGTVLQRYGHAAVDNDDLRIGWQENPDVDRATRSFALMEILSLLVLDTYQADLTFFVPLQEMASPTMDLSYAEKVEMQMRDVLEKLKIRHYVLTGDLEQQVESAMGVISEREKS
jgi:hypothetical protein